MSDDPFGEMWFGRESQAVLADLYQKVAHLDGNLVEVGCWTGRSTVALAKACTPAVVHAVDTWQGSPGEISAELAAERDVYAQFCRNVGPLGNVVAYRMGWRDYFAKYAQPTRLLHIDATHTYEEVRDNLIEALPHMVAGGIVCGDDVHHPPVQAAILEVLGDTNTAATLWWKQL